MYDYLIIVCSLFLFHFHRPVNEERNRVAPDDLQDHRKSHKFRGPCCLCPTDSIDAVYTESAIFMATGGVFSGKHLAACSTGQCGYISKLNIQLSNCISDHWPIQSHWTTCITSLAFRWGYIQTEVVPVSNIITRHSNNCTLLVAGEPVPKAVLHLPGLANPSGVPAALAEMNAVMASIPTWKRPEKRKRTALDEFLLLDSLTDPGLPQSKFRRLFARCGCGWITMRRAFGNHVCAEAGAVQARYHPVIDLTSDDDSGDDLIDLTIDDDDIDDDDLLDLTIDDDLE